jgi:hypothetical protein
VITTTPANAGRVAKQARLLGVPATVIGKVGGSSLSIKTSQGQIEAEVGILHSAWWNSIAIAMNQPASSSDQ